MPWWQEPTNTEVIYTLEASYIEIDSDNRKKFKFFLQKFLSENSFYSLDEILSFKKVKFIFIWSKLVFESLAQKIDLHFCFSFFNYLSVF